MIKLMIRIFLFIKFFGLLSQSDSMSIRLDSIKGVSCSRDMSIRGSYEVTIHDEAIALQDPDFLTLLNQMCNIMDELNKVSQQQARYSGIS